MRRAPLLLSLLLLLGTPLAGMADRITFDFFRDKPRSLAKDFYISRFLDQNVTSTQARALLGEVKNMNWRLFHKFAARVDDFAFERISFCRELSPLQFVGKENDCIKVGLTPYKATKLPPEKLKRIAEQIAWQYPEDAALYRLIAARDFNRTSQSGAKIFLQLFNRVGNDYRQKYLNHLLPPRFVTELSRESAFNTAVVKIVQDPKLTQLQRSILKLDASSLNAKSNFYLGLNALKLGHKEIAIWYFKAAEKKAWLDFDRDKARFWQYLITRKKEDLKALLKSRDLNLYTLYASEKLGKSPKNIVTDIEPKHAKAPFDITDPFVWLQIQRQFKACSYADQKAKERAALKLNAADTQPHVASLLYTYGDHLHYFLTPYRQAVSSLSPQRKALLYAIARQESHLIPTAISYSYALGMMQFMPFLAKAVAKEQGIRDFRLEAIFHPDTALKFADFHLDYLEKSLYHPLLIAYAYNAGIGYTRRKILQNDHYFTAGEYEPFLSIEMLPNAQARKYGKRVLTNYVIYAKIFGAKDIRLLTLLEKLREKSRISRF